MSQFLDRYFGNGFRWFGLCRSVVVVFGAFVAMCHELHIPGLATEIISWSAAAVGAFLYICNPKDREWMTEAEETEGSTETPEATTDAANTGS